MEQVVNTLNKINSFLKEQNLTGEISYTGDVSHLVRAAGNQISLNTSEITTDYTVQLQDGKKVVEGTYVGPVDDVEGIKGVINKLKESLGSMPELPFLTPMEPIALGAKTTVDSDKKVEDIDSNVMVSLYERAIDRFRDKDVIVSGAFSAGSSSYAIVNTLSSEALYYKGSDYNAEVVLQLPNDDKKELRAAFTGENLAEYNQDQILDHLEEILKLKRTTSREDIEAGQYDVVFSADAFVELVSMFSYLTVSGESFEYGTGMLQKEKHKIGDKLFSEKFTMIDDPDDSEVLYRRHFGQNGIARGRFPLIEKGVLKNMYYSSKKTCDRFNKKVINDMSVSSPKIIADDGPSTFEQMIKQSSSKTIYIPFIHYMNLTNAAKGEFTGTSRFGTFLLEDGKVKSHLYKLRINDSMHDIFNNIDWLSSKLVHVNTANTYGTRNAGSIACPAFVRVKGVKISGTSCIKE